MKSNRKLSIVASMLAICLVLAGCGNNNNEPQDGEGSVTLATAPPETSATEYFETVDDISSKIIEDDDEDPLTTTYVEDEDIDPLTTSYNLDTDITEETTTSAVNVNDNSTVALQIAENACNAMINKDTEGMVKYVNLDAQYYLASGEWLSEKEVAAKLVETGVESPFFALFDEFVDFQVVSAKPCADDELDDLNAFIKERIAVEGLDANLLMPTEAYKIELYYEGIEEEIANNPAAPYLLVVNSPSGLKLDLTFSTIMELYRSLDELSLSSKNTTDTK